MTAEFTIGSLVRARGRDWVVQPGSANPMLHLRPLGGSDDDGAWLHLGLEPDVSPARFPRPDPACRASQDAAALLADALLMSLRRGAGPFRSFGQLAFEPRAYQLVPLMMALRLDTVRLLIADDVGIGKTIEAGMIARELLDRGEIRRIAVLCPPHLVDQWVLELAHRFHLAAEPVTAATAGRLERGLPPATSIFEAHPVTVVSLDYIKSERRRHEFTRACPEFVIVDEAHTCANTGQGRHRRYELLRALAADSERHLVLLTATPHSGDEAAFFHLLGLLDAEFEQLAVLEGTARDRLRDRLARHFVQRRRPDIDEWHDGRLFPDRRSAEATYRLTGDWWRFLESVLDYCAEAITSGGADERRQRLNFWGTLALMRCVSSSPAAAARALRSRLAGEDGLEDEDILLERVLDGESDALSQDDVEPAADTGDVRLDMLVGEAERLRGVSGDPKLRLLTEQLDGLLEAGFNPVVFCRYIATANYLGEHLRSRWRGVTVAAVTGELVPEERERAVAALGEHPNRLLVATDCLSEGVNLQEHFDAVVHYDLSWNPTRHEQREGRVDRFGQKSREVRALLIYGENNPVDGAVLKVILSKAERIRTELGISVPMPGDEGKVTQALMKAVLLRHRAGMPEQALLDFGDTEDVRAMDVAWTRLADTARRSRAIFSQRRLKPAEVLPEWERTRLLLGGPAEVGRFVRRALSRLGAPLHFRRERGAEAPLGALPLALRDRLAAEQLEDTVSVDFDYPPARDCRFISRSHPLVAVLAEELLERSLDAEGASDAALARLGRTGVWRSRAVDRPATVWLLRLRHRLTVQRRDHAERELLVEEAAAIAFLGRQHQDMLTGPGAFALLSYEAAGDLAPVVVERELDALASAWPTLEARAESFASAQAGQLLADHRRVREAADTRGRRYAVEALTPVDVVAAYVLLPVT
ncbi:MAG: DEAD/DEAH box helicase [Steroidobacteraceae bacterium]|nr:DEAD/DEAH box helicase [Steroidobacteraceae bacterium]